MENNLNTLEVRFETLQDQNNNMKFVVNDAAVKLRNAAEKYSNMKNKLEATKKELEKQKNKFSFDNFFHMQSISNEHIGLDIITTKEFSRCREMTLYHKKRFKI